LNNLSSQTTFAKKLLYVIEHKMLRCAPDEREKIDVICTDLSNILESILKAGDPYDVAQGLSSSLSQDLAHIRRDDSAPSLRAPSRITSFEELRESVTEDQDLLLEDADDPGLLMRTRSRKSRRETDKQSEDHRISAPSTHERGVSKLPAETAIVTITPKETKDQLLEVILEPEHTEVSREDAASSHIPDRSRPINKLEKTKHLISQKSKKWFREPLTQLKRKLKGRSNDPD
jgi:hypothetical protein